MSKIFISYSHSDKSWKNRLETQLAVLELEGYFTVWDDQKIKLGKDWLPEIERELNQAQVAIMLVSADFLVSNFIRTKEIPVFLRRRKREGMLLAPLLIKPCAWHEVPWLEEIKGGSEDNVALSGLSEHDQDQTLADLAREIKAILHPKTNQPSPTTLPHPKRPPLRPPPSATACPPSKVTSSVVKTN